jgi:hypothetical protein
MMMVFISNGKSAMTWIRLKSGPTNFDALRLLLFYSSFETSLPLSNTLGPEEVEWRILSNDLDNA